MVNLSEFLPRRDFGGLDEIAGASYYWKFHLQYTLQFIYNMKGWVITTEWEEAAERWFLKNHRP